MTARHAFLIDLDRCIGCQACVVACHTGNEIPAGDTFITVSDVVRGQAPRLWGSFLHRRCYHCGAAPCVTVCPTGTLSKRNGLTAVAFEKCSGCGYCTDACPFHIPHLVEGRVSKCIGCADRVEDGREPWCVQTCPNRAITFGDSEAVLAHARARVEAVRPRHPRAQVYGQTQLEGLGLFTILLEGPEAYGLPEQAEMPATLTLWQRAVQPGSVGVSALAAAGMGLAFVIARRQHAREKAEMEHEGKTQPAEEPRADGPDHD
jgi:formate dehydrogenase iron-sulfur subunit